MYLLDFIKKTLTGEKGDATAGPVGPVDTLPGAFVERAAGKGPGYYNSNGIGPCESHGLKPFIKFTRYLRPELSAGRPEAACWGW